MEEMSASKWLADWVAGIRYNRIPADIVEKAKIYLMDWFFCLIAGYTTDTGKKALKTAESIMNGDIKYFRHKLSPLGVAFASGVMSHSLEMDDLHRGSILHPASPIISSVFASSIMAETDGKKLIEGIVAGYDTGIAVGECLGKEHYRWFHTTATAGLFGGVAGSGKVTDLSEEKLIWAFGNAGSFSSGLWEFLESGGDTKPIHPGKSAFESILLVKMANNNIRGPLKIFEGNRGICRVLSRKCNINALKLKNHRVGEVSLKLYPSCRHTHPVIDAVLKAQENWKKTSNVEVYTYKEAINVAGIENPKTEFEAKFSIPYCVSIALLFGNVELKHFGKEYLFSDSVRKMMKRVRVIEDAKLSEEFPLKWGAKVNIKGEDATETQVDFPRGDPENPPTMDELLHKYESMMNYSGFEVDVGEIRNVIMSIDGRDVSEMLELILL